MEEIKPAWTGSSRRTPSERGPVQSPAEVAGAHGGANGAANGTANGSANGSAHVGPVATDEVPFDAPGVDVPTGGE